MFTSPPSMRALRVVIAGILAMSMLATLAPPPQLAAVLPAPPSAAAQEQQYTWPGPRPGEVFRQYRDDLNGSQTALCNASGSRCGGVPSEQNRQTNNVLLTNATRAEAIFAYWGGHLATTQQEFRVNGGSWAPFPAIQGIPADTLDTCYFRNPTNAIAEVPLDGSGGIRPAGNSGATVNVVYRYRVGPQLALDECAPGSNFYWGNMWVYEVTTRIYYNPETTTSPRGTITAPANGGTLTENIAAGQRPTISVSAQAPAGRTISRVDLIGNYLDYDWDGDGVLREWHYALRDIPGNADPNKTVWERTIGTLTAPSSGTNTNGVYNFTWDSEWVPDQDQPVMLMARITDSQGYSYMTPLVTADFNRVGRSVRMYNTWSDYFGTRVFGPPRNYGMNIFQSPRLTGKRTTISIPDPLTSATRARFQIYTWGGNPCCEDPSGKTDVVVNNRFIWQGTERFGLYHNYSFDQKTYNDPRSFLNQGDNTLIIWSNRNNHKLEVLWPGPAIFVEYSAPPTTPGITANPQSLNTPEDQALPITLTATNPGGAALTYTVLTQPTLGTLSGAAPNLTYTPNPEVSGGDSFSFRVNDQFGRVSEATVSIAVQNVADAPQINLGQGALLNPGDRFQRIVSVSDPDSPSLTATVDYGTGDGPIPLAINAGGLLQLDHLYRRGGRFTLTVSVSDGGQTSVASAIINVLSPGSPSPTANWALDGYRYRVSLEAQAGAYPRLHRVAEFDVNFSTALSQAGGSGALIRNSIRVVEVDDSGTVLNDNVTYQFDPASNFNATSNARGTLLVLMEGTTPANSSRRFQVYFETNGSFAAPQFSPLVEVTNPALANYRRDTAAVIETRDPNGARNSTYYYSLNGGGFISMLDRLNADWINYSSRADSRGSYRGVPNVGAVYHPGYYSTYPANIGNDGGSLQRSTTTIEGQGPLRTVVRSISSNGQWEATWEFFPTSTRMTMLRVPNNATWWWLYEGTPGGTLDGSDRWVRADGSAAMAYDPQFQFRERFHSDLPGAEWVYFRAGEAAQGGRAIWVANHNDSDTSMDMYRQQNDSFGDESAMTVFGFGRREFNDDGSQTLRAEFTGAQRRFSMGFLEAAPSSFDADAGLLVEGSYRDLTLSVGQGQRLLTNLAPWAPDLIYRTKVNTTLTVAAPGIRSSISDGDGDPLTISLVSEPANGQLSLNTSTGAFTYVPNPDFEGDDSFSYTVSDGKNPAPTTTVTLRVSQNSVPTPAPSGPTPPATNNATPLVVAAPGLLQGASDADGDPLTAVLVETTFGGTLVLRADGSFTYTPNPDFVGTDSFSFAISDGDDQTDPITVEIVVTDSNRAPTGNNSSASTQVNTELVVNVPGVLAGASDPDGNELSAVLLTGPTRGTLVLRADGSYTYTPNTDFVGTDSFSFAISDGRAQSQPRTVQITVTDQAGAPIPRVFLPLLRR